MTSLALRADAAGKSPHRLEPTACVLPGRTGASCPQRGVLGVQRCWRQQRSPAPGLQDYEDRDHKNLHIYHQEPVFALSF